MSRYEECGSKTLEFIMDRVISRLKSLTAEGGPTMARRNRDVADEKWYEESELFDIHGLLSNTGSLST